MLGLVECQRMAGKLAERYHWRVATAHVHINLDLSVSWQTP